MIKLILLLAWLFLPSLGAGEEDVGQTVKSGDLEQVRERIRQIQASLQGLENQQSSLTGQLAGIERQYGALVKASRKLEAEVLERTRRSAAVAKQQGRLKAGIRQQNQALAAQLRAAYAAGRQEWLKLALSQEESAHTSRVLTYYKYLNQARFSQLQTLQRDLKQSVRLEEELADAAKHLEQTRFELARQQAQLNEARSERQEVLAKLEVEADDKNDQLRLLQEDERRLQGLLGSLQEAMAGLGPPDAAAQQATPSQGRAALPVKGPVLAAFGAPRMSGKWDGVLIGAPEGTPVRSVSSGHIAFADWLRGYGLLTIVDHGDGYMSLYAFNQSLFKNVGDRVDAGEAIASVGASGGQRQPGLYFGVRQKGKPIDPLAWCARAN